MSLKNIRNKGNLGVAMVSNIISVLISTIISFLLTKYLIEEIGKVAYSYYPIANNFINCFMVVFASMNVMSSRFITVSLLNGEKDKSISYYSSIFYVNVFISLILFVFAVVCILNLSTILNIPDELYFDVLILFVFTFLSGIITALTNVFLVAPYAKNRMDLRAVIDLVQNTSKFIILIYFYYTGNLNLITFGFSVFVSTLFFLLISYFFKKALLDDYKVSLRYFSLTRIKEIVLSSIYILISNLGIMLVTNSQLIIINTKVSVDAAATLSLTQTLSSFALLISNNLMTILSPYITKNIVVNKEKFKENISELKAFSFIFTAIPIIILIVFGRQFYLLWLPNENANLLSLFSAFSLIQVLTRYFYIVEDNILISLNKIKVKSVSSFTFGIAYVILAYVGTTHFSLDAYFVLISATLFFIVYHFVFVKLYSNKVLKEQKYDIKISNMSDVVLLLFILASNVILSHFICQQSLIMLVIIAGSVAVLDISAVLIFKRISVKNMMSFIFDGK